MNTPSSIHHIPKELVKSLDQIHSSKVRQSFLQLIENFHQRNNNHKNL